MDKTKSKASSAQIREVDVDSYLNKVPLSRFHMQNYAEHDVVVAIRWSWNTQWLCQSADVMEIVLPPTI